MYRVQFGFLARMQTQGAFICEAGFVDSCLRRNDGLGRRNDGLVLTQFSNVIVGENLDAGRRHVRDWRFSIPRMPPH